MKYLIKNIVIATIIITLTLAPVAKPVLADTAVSPTPTAATNQVAPTAPPSPTPPESSPTPTATTVSNGQITSPTPTPTSSSTTSPNANGTTTPTVTDPANTNNGAHSNNNATDATNATTTTNQNNGATVGNGLTQSATTGNNSSSANVGNSAVKTSDANVSGTVVNTGNTNLQGVAVAEFDINDNQNGDLVLGDFANHCIIGCTSGGIAANTGNGTGSTNNANLNQNSQNETFQNNDANVGNSLVLSADSGHNTTSLNTGGNSSLTTGNANVDGNVLSFLNNNIAGQVLVNVINIFGDLNGDIILPADESCDSCSQGSLSATNSGNGVNSTNNANNTNNNTQTTNQTNLANISNNLDLSATTGNNSTTGNTGGDSSVNSGAANVQSKVLNVANNNVDEGGVWWLVLINNAGHWVGKLLGFPDGTMVAGSAGTQITTNSSGDVTASNNRNGANSSNNASTSQNNTSTTSQSNNAKLSNSLKLSANTGNNHANYNTGGNTTVTTGDANVIANLVNFVNNNIKGKGKLIVTIVNVFGNWVGDLVTPGQHKQNKTSNGAAQSTSSPVQNQTNNQTQNSTANNPQTNAVQAIDPQNQHANSLFSPYTHTANNMNISQNSDAITPPSFSATDTATQNNAQTGGTTSVLAASTKAEKKAVTINLAYLLFLIPLAAVYITMKKRKLIRI